MPSHAMQREIERHLADIKKLFRENDRLGQVIKLEERGQANAKGLADADRRIARSKDEVRRLQRQIEDNKRQVQGRHRVVGELRRLR